MATMTDNVARIKAAKKAIRAAIEGKGIEVPENDLIGTYAAKISSIQGGGEGMNLAGTGWEDETLFPVFVPRAADLAKDLDYTRIKKSEWDTVLDHYTAKDLYLNDQNLVYAPKIKTLDVTDMSGMFNGCSNLVAIPGLRTSKVLSMDNCFRDCSQLRSIPHLDTFSATTAHNMLVGCKALEEVGGFKDFKTDLNLSWCSGLTELSLINIIENLADLHKIGSPSRTIVLNPTSYNKLGKKRIGDIQKKGWNLLKETNSTAY